MPFVIPQPPLIVIADDFGGILADYALQAGRWKASKQSVAITGTCASSCTLYLMAKHTCVTASAKIQLHAAFDRRDGKLVPWATDLLMHAYPPPLRNWVRRHGGLTANVLTLEGHDLTSMFPVCATAASEGMVALRHH